MRFDFHLMSDWPILAWLAKCARAAPVVSVFHGPNVETGDEFFTEAAWAGDYRQADFDTTDIVAGSGARLRGDSIIFVSSGSTVDRLNVCDVGDFVWVSNSLACLLSGLGATVDASYPHYCRDFYSVVDGIENYKRDLASSAGNIELVYFNNLRWNGDRLEIVAKPAKTLPLDNFDRYFNFLDESMARLSANLGSSRRSHPYSMLATISTGYDSPTVAGLARRAGCREALCFDRSHKGDDDSGHVIARHLGIEAIRVPGDAWKSIEYPEVPFLASNSMGEEVRFRAAEDRLAGKVLFTGYHGDKVWDPHTKALGPSLVRGDPSGLALSEYRLWVGFIHCPVPFWGARQIRLINAIARSEEMRSWDMGGDYNRPVCRRIVEQCGVPRELFGVKKKNASVMLHNYDELLTTASRNDFLAWLNRHRHEWIKKKRIPPFPSAALDRAVHVASQSLSGWLKRTPLAWRLAGRMEGRPTYLRKYLFPWALERAIARYPTFSR